MIKMQIDTGNAAFSDSAAGIEVARILRKLADQMEGWSGDDDFDVNLFDYNGNRVGHVNADPINH